MPSAGQAKEDANDDGEEVVKEKSLLLRTYPPKFAKGAFVAIAWRRTFTIARTREAANKGQEKTIVVEEMRKIKRGVYTEPKKPKAMDAETKFIIAVVDDISNVDTDSLEKHHLQYWKEYSEEE